MPLANPASGRSKVVTFTRDRAAASGTQAVTGVGFKPTGVIILGAGSSTVLACVGAVDQGLGQGAIAAFSSAGNFAYAGAHALYMGVDGANYQQADLQSLDVDGFTLNWSKGGSPTSATMTFVAICF